MANAFVITEYLWQGHKQLLLEKLQGGETGYRVIIVKRCNTLDAAKQAYLAEIPAGRIDYYNGVIEDYAAQHGIKTTQEAKKRPTPVYLPKKGKKNDQSKRKGA